MLEYQQKMLEYHYDFLKYKIENNILICTGWIESSDYLNKYKIEIRCVVGFHPSCKILEPSDIKPSSSIHMYEDHTLCLYYPPDLKFSSRTPLYKFTIPWLIEWIHYYELYLINGNLWEGKESPAHMTEADKDIAIDYDVS